MVALVALVLLYVPHISRPASADAEGSGPLATLIEQIAQRLQTAEAVAASKFLFATAIDDPAREQHVIDSVTATAAARGIDSASVDRVFRDQIDAAEALEHSRFAQWDIELATGPKASPDLATSRAVINHLDEEIIERISRQWNSLHSPTCDANLTEAKTAAIATVRFDDTYRRAMDFATRSLCQ